MLNAMQQGNDGSLSTIHANSSRDVIAKIQTYALQAHERLPFEATNGLIANALNFIVFLRRIRTEDGTQRRIIESIREVAGRDEDGVKTTELWTYNKSTGRTEFTRKAVIREEALLDVGWDPDGATDLNRFAQLTGTNGDQGWQI